MRRFPDIITRLREAPGERNQFGEWQPGAVEEKKYFASVQPLKLMDIDLLEGSRLIHRRKVYIPEADVLEAAHDDAGGDRVRVDDVEYSVESSESWNGSHTKAVIVRST